MKSANALGSLSAFGAAFGYGSAYVVARFAYDYGLNAFSLNFLRFLVLAAILVTWAIVTRSGFRPPPRSLPLLVCVGVLITISGLTNYGAIAFIPVSLAILIFYTFPLFTLLLNAVVERRPPRGIEYVAFLFAFSGLALTLEVSMGALDVRGVALALTAAVTVAVHLVVSQHAMRLLGFKMVTLYMSLTALVLTGIITLGLDQFSVPGPGPGLLALGYVVVGFSLAMGAMLTGVRLIGPVRTSMVMCMEPPVVIVCAWLLLGEHLTTRQLGGAALVLTGIVLAQGAAARRAREPAA